MEIIHQGAEKEMRSQIFMRRRVYQTDPIECLELFWYLKKLASSNMTILRLLGSRLRTGKLETGRPRYIRDASILGTPSLPEFISGSSRRTYPRNSDGVIPIRAVVTKAWVLRKSSLILLYLSNSRIYILIVFCGVLKN
jgi:hypothetical protein